MEEIALFAVLKGIKFTEELYWIQEAVLDKWVDKLCVRTNPFFKQLRKFIVCELQEKGRQVLVEEFGIDEATVTELEKTVRAQEELEKTVLELFYKGLSLQEVSSETSLSVSKVQKILRNQGRPTKLQKTEEELK